MVNDRCRHVTRIGEEHPEIAHRGELQTESEAVHIATPPVHGGEIGTVELETTAQVGFRHTVVGIPAVAAALLGRQELHRHAAAPSPHLRRRRRRR